MKKHKFERPKEGRNPNSISVNELKRGTKPFVKPKGPKRQQSRLVIQETIEEAN